MLELRKSFWSRAGTAPLIYESKSPQQQSLMSTRIDTSTSVDMV